MRSSHSDEIIARLDEMLYVNHLDEIISRLDEIITHPDEIITNVCMYVFIKSLLTCIT